MNIIETFTKFNKSDKIKYTDFYQRYFSNIHPKLLLEIGVLEGDSLRSWKEIFPNIRIVGIDINPETKEKCPDLEIFIGDQRDLSFLDEVINAIGIPDIVIDDGGHRRSMQVQSHAYIFPKLNSGGLYIIEDLNTDYIPEFNDSELSTTEYLKSLIDTRKLTKIIFEYNICVMIKA